MVSTKPRSDHASTNLTNLVYVCLGIGFLDNLKKILNEDGITIFLQVMAQRLQNTVRNTDLLAHINEEQFVICFINTGSFNPKDFITRILEHLSSPLVIEGIEVIVTTHFGISLYPNDANDFVSLRDHANLAYQHAKKANIVNNYEFFKSELLTSKTP